MFWCGVLACGMFLPASAAAEPSIVVSGVLDIPRLPQSNHPEVLTGEHGFTWRYPLSMLVNLFPLFDPALPGTMVTLSIPGWDSCTTVDVTFEGISYRSGCSTGRVSFAMELSGTVVLPPHAPTATVTAPFALSGWVGDPSGGRLVSFSGTGTATYYLHSIMTPSGLTPWVFDRAVLRLDGPLPAPWTAVDVGAVGVAGTAVSNGASATEAAFTVAGAGADVWGSVDAFQFVQAYPNGDTIVARVDSLQNTDPWAKAGIMIRRSFDSASPHVFLAVKPNGGIELLAREAQGGSTSLVATSEPGFPVWLRLTGQTEITASISSDGQSWQTIATLPQFLAGFHPSLGGLAVTSRDASMLAEALFSHASVSGTPPPFQPLPLLLTGHDIGPVQEPGSASAPDGTTVTVNARGADIWGTSDQFYYVDRSFPEGDGEMIARVTSLENSSPWAKAGVMIREGRNADAAHVFLAVKPDGGIELLSRPSAGEQTLLIAEGFQPFPAWLRLQRRGLTHIAAVSADGIAWNVLGQIELTQQWGGGIGLAVTSQNTSMSTTAVFDSLAVTNMPALPHPWGHLDVGSTGLSGSAQYNAGTFTISGAGADIWGQSDSFHFVITGIQGDAMLSARLVSETNTDMWAKAGLMIRPYASSPDSPFVMIAMKPDGEIEVLQRDTTGGFASYLGGASPGIGAHLRLQRDGANVLLSYSTDGTTWTSLMSVPIPGWPALATIGMAVTSRHLDRLNTAVFDSVVGP